QRTGRVCGARVCHGGPMRGAQPRPDRTGFTVAPGPASRAEATDRCSRRCPQRGNKAAAVVTGLESRENDSETLSPETFGARSEQACSDRAPNDLSKCPPERRAARKARKLENH